jgi:hypothetical protein
VFSYFLALETLERWTEELEERDDERKRKEEEFMAKFVEPPALHYEKQLSKDDKQINQEGGGQTERNRESRGNPKSLSRSLDTGSGVESTSSALAMSTQRQCLPT